MWFPPPHLSLGKDFKVDVKLSVRFFLQFVTKSFTCCAIFSPYWLRVNLPEQYYPLVIVPT